METYWTFVSKRKIQSDLLKFFSKTPFFLPNHLISSRERLQCLVTFYRLWLMILSSQKESHDMVLICLLHLCFPDGSVVKNPSSCQCRRWEFNPWVRKIPWRRKWLLTPVFLPQESCGQRCLAGYSPYGCKESELTKVTEHARITKFTLQS